MKVMRIVLLIGLLGLLASGLQLGRPILSQVRNKGVDPEWANKLKEAPSSGFYSHGLPRDLFFATYEPWRYGNLPMAVFAPNGGWIIMSTGRRDSYQFSGLPTGAMSGLKALPHGIFLLEAAFTANDGWLYVWLDQNNRVDFSSGNVPQRMLVKLREIYKAYPRGYIHLTLTPDGGWLILYAQVKDKIFSSEVKYLAAYENLPKDVETRVQELLGRGESIESVVFAPNGGWVILYGANGYLYDRIPEDATRVLSQLHQYNKSIYEVALGTNGSWLIIAQIH